MSLKDTGSANQRNGNRLIESEIHRLVEKVVTRGHRHRVAVWRHWCLGSLCDLDILPGNTKRRRRRKMMKTRRRWRRTRRRTRCWIARGYQRHRPDALQWGPTSFVFERIRPEEANGCVNSNSTSTPAPHLMARQTNQLIAIHTAIFFAHF